MTQNILSDPFPPERFQRYRYIGRVLWYVLFLNLLVAAAKVGLGLVTRCLSVLADGVHSFSDASSNILGLIGIHLARQPSDFDHPYGHRRYETLASLGIAGLLFLVSFNLLREALDLFWHPRNPSVEAVSFLVMVVTVAVNIGVTLYERGRAEELESDLLRSDSMHTASDVLVSVSVLAGLGLIRFGWAWVDPVITVLISIVIFRVAVSIVKQSSDVLCDHNVLDADEVIKLVATVEGARGCHMVRSRGHMDDIQLDLHLLVPDEMDIKHAHDVANRVERVLRDAFRGVTDVVVHLEPKSSLDEGHI